MKYFIKLGFVLLLITSIASGVLAFLNGVTEPIIRANKSKAEISARMEVLPEAKNFVLDSLKVEAKEIAPDPLMIEEEISADGTFFKYYVGYDENNNVVGYTFTASLYGYSGDVKTMVGIGKDLKINKIKIISQSETPGLGANCTQQSFQDRFTALTANDLLVDKDGGNVKSLTGATITTRTITNSIREGLNALVEAVTNKTATPETTVDPITPENVVLSTPSKEA